MNLMINEKQVEIEVLPQMPLLWVLREPNTVVALATVVPVRY